MYTPALVEYLGTSLLIGAVAFTGAPLVIISALAIAIYLGGKISGGHFNPAVTLWALYSGKVSGMKALYYILAQVAAAVTIWGLGAVVRV